MLCFVNSNFIAGEVNISCQIKQFVQPKSNKQFKNGSRTISKTAEKNNKTCR